MGIPTTIYVEAQISEDGNFAACKYFKNQDGTDEYPTSDISIWSGSNECIFAQADTTQLMLIGATFKTIGSPAGMNASNFAPADDENTIRFSMPLTQTITKGVVLLFSNSGIVENLYPSTDPQVTNDATQPPSCEN